jgi:hypothetical protein
MEAPERETEKEPVEGEAADRISKFVDGFADSPFSAPIVLICLLANLLLWLLVLASPSTVAWIVDRLTTSSGSEGNSRGGVLLIMALPFILPFIAVYSVARNRHPDIEDESSIETGMMAGYAYRQRTDKRWKIWLLSGMTGGLNCVLLLAVYIFRK